MPSELRGKRFLFLLMGGTLAGGLFMLFRSSTALLYPSLALEDARELYSYYSKNTEWGALYRYYSGYVSIWPNLAGWIAVRLPPSWAPGFLAFHALAWALTARMVLGLRRFRFMLPDDRIRIAIGLFLCVYPFGNYALTSVTMFQHFHMLWVLFLLVIAPVSLRWPGVVLQSAAQALMVWSHPLAVLLAPFGLANLGLRRNPRDWTANLVLLLAIVSYAFLGIEGHDKRERTWAHVLSRSAEYFEVRVLVEAWFGNTVRLQIVESGNEALVWLAVLSAAGLLLGAGIWAWHSLRGWGPAIALASLAGTFCFTILVVYVRNLDMLKDYLR